MWELWKGSRGLDEGACFFFGLARPAFELLPFIGGKDLEINAGEISTGWTLCATASTDASPWSSQEHVHLITLMAVPTSFSRRAVSE